MSREPVGRRRPDRAAGVRNTWLVFAVVAMAVSVAVLMVVVVNAMGDEDGSTPAAGATETTTAARTATSGASAAGSPTTAPTQSSTSSQATSAVTSPTTKPTAGQPSPTATVKAGEFPLVNCLDLYARADKNHIMAPSCAPSDLVQIPNSGQEMRSEAAEAFNQMVDAAAKEGVTITAVSGFRSYQTQDAVYASAVAGYGQEYADRTSAKPGHSEHQLGTVMDVSTPSEGGELEESFGDTPAGIWVKNNSYKYGFIISYPAGTESITGYAFEPWHIRYLRKDVAKQIHDSGLTITEFLAKR